MAVSEVVEVVPTQGSYDPVETLHICPISELKSAMNPSP